jgi:hypothetical protein
MVNGIRDHFLKNDVLDRKEIHKQKKQYCQEVQPSFTARERQPRRKLTFD